jgi:OmpA-OmpF porin, OOP family
VLDPADQCPNTPAGQQVNATGCPLVVDSDNDGVSNDKDRCDNTPVGMAVDASGCPIDSDGDGVTDASDQCAHTPRGETVDGTGCPVRDSDGDGIADKLDRCPNTPHSVVVGSDGCVIVFVEGKKNVVLQGVTFLAGRAELTIDAKKVLDLVAQSLNNSPEVTFEIQGHASSDGADAYNLRLSERRAASVRAYLISKRVAANRMTSKGYGETMPIADNATKEGRDQNRRVELVRTDQ